MYVDGYFAGIVDDYRHFSGCTPRRADTRSPYTASYRTYSQVYLAPDRTFKFSHEMEERRLETGKPRLADSAGRRGQPGPPRDPFGRRGPRRAASRRRVQSSSHPRLNDRAGSSHGTLELNLQPADAEVLVDGQPWRGSGQDRLTIDLSDGRHNIQVRKAGYVGYLTDITIRNGETTSLNVNLRTQPPR